MKKHNLGIPSYIELKNGKKKKNPEYRREYQKRFERNGLKMMKVPPFYCPTCSRRGQLLKMTLLNSATGHENISFFVHHRRHSSSTNLCYLPVSMKEFVSTLLKGLYEK